MITDTSERGLDRLSFLRATQPDAASALDSISDEAEA